MGYSLTGKLNQALIICFAVFFFTASAPFLYLNQTLLAQDTGNLLSPNPRPTIVFTDSIISVNESSQRVTIGVKLLNPSSLNNDISVEISYLEEPSSAGLPDLRKSGIQFISFNQNDSSGTVKNISISLTDDNVYEGRRSAFFQLQDISGAEIGEPDRVEVRIIDDDAPKVVINEIYAGASATVRDINQPGNKRISETDFIELVNNEDVDVDISGWVLTSENGLRYQFPSNSIVKAGRALVVFGENAPKGNYGGAQLLTAEEFNLAAEGDRLVLSDIRRNPIDDITYDQRASENQSLNRDADLQKNLVLHSQLQESSGKRFSPGKQPDGTSFGSRFAMGFREGEGWYLLASPTSETSFRELFDGIFTQGSSVSSAGSQQPNILTWNEEDRSYSQITDLNQNPESGNGYFIYLSEEDFQQSPGMQGGVPKFIQTNSTEPAGRVTVVLSADDSNDNSVIDGMEGWNLVGNPFGSDLSVDALLARFEAFDPTVNANIMIWDPSYGSGNGAFISVQPGETIAPFQAFWVRYANADGVEGSVSFTKSDLTNTERRSFQSREDNSQQINLSLSDGIQFDEYLLEFNNSGTTALDRFDAYKLYSLNPDAINLFGTSGTNKLSKNVLPIDLENNLELPVAFEAPNRSSLELQWTNVDQLPEQWEVNLVDRLLNREIDMRTTQSYRFEIPGNEVRSQTERSLALIQPRLSGPADSEPRFLLSIKPSTFQQNQSTDIPESVKLNPNYPNPFNPATTISYELKEDAEVILSIWNIVGQKVTTLVDGMVEAGEHTATWNASDMPSGLYIAQLEVGGQVFIRKMTLIK